MLVNERFRKCVTFLYADSGGDRRPVASAFLVGLHLFDHSSGSAFATYVVTARHAIDGLEPVWLRMRTRDGGFVDLPVPTDAWEQHPQTDVAVAAIQLDKTFDAIFVPVETFATEAFIQEHEVSEGDEVFFSGLFVPHPGKDAPQPIIRFGNIALMPREPVRLEVRRHPPTFAEVEAYLTEARSWSGQSGSPAFLSFPPDRRVLGGGPLQVGGQPPFALLGLVQGIWKDPAGAEVPDPSGEGIVEVNMGITAVIPAYKIVETLMSERLVEQRASLEAEMKRAPGPTPPSASSMPPPSDDFEHGA